VFFTRASRGLKIQEGCSEGLDNCPSFGFKKTKIRILYNSHTTIVLDPSLAINSPQIIIGQGNNPLALEIPHNSCAESIIDYLVIPKHI